MRGATVVVSEKKFNEKALYVEKAASKKGEYGIALKLHNVELAEAKEKFASTSKSSSEVHDDVEELASPQGEDCTKTKSWGGLALVLGKWAEALALSSSLAWYMLVGVLALSSIGIMARSFSLKDNSTSSVPEPSPASFSLILRRIFDPLLKLKGSQEKVQKSNLDPSPISATHNGIPFFELVVKSRSDILVADVIKLPSEDDSSLIYAFYSLAAIIVKNLSDKTCGDIGSSKSTVVILPESVHSWPNSVLLPLVINRVLYSTDIVDGTLNGKLASCYNCQESK
ncbi:hypothetical protein Tco_0341290 [Tanacetum coccineum]